VIIVRVELHSAHTGVGQGNTAEIRRRAADQKRLADWRQKQSGHAPET
jgi:hypothetical protein